MRFRAVLCGAHRGEQALSRYVAPRGPAYTLFLCRRLAEALDRLEGPCRSHWPAALAAVVLTRMGVVGGPLPRDAAELVFEVPAAITAPTGAPAAQALPAARPRSSR